MGLITSFALAHSFDAMLFEVRPSDLCFCMTFWPTNFKRHRSGKKTSLHGLLSNPTLGVHQGGIKEGVGRGLDGAHWPPLP